MRLVVLPFRVLRPDPETDFLAFSLPDAISTSLSGVGSLVLRSSAVAARYASEAPDLKALAAEADVDRVVLGTLLRAGDQLRVTAQLVEAPSGTLLTSQTIQSSMGDLFRLQDDIAHRIVEALSLPLTGATPQPTPDAPHDARAYELYLRGNELARTYGGLERRARSVPAKPRAGLALRAGLGSTRPLPSRHRQVRRRRTRKRVARRGRASAVRSPSTRGCQSRTSSTRTSKPTSARPTAPSCACSVRPAGMATIRSCLPASCTRVATAACSSSPSPRTPRRVGWTPTCPPAIEQTLLLTGDVDRLIGLEQPAVDRRRRRWHPRDRLGIGRAPRRGAERLAVMRQSSRIPAFEMWTGSSAGVAGRRREA